MDAKQAKENHAKALVAGEKTYIGRPCKNCGSPIKLVKYSSCQACTKERGLKKLADDKLMAKYRTPEKLRNAVNKWRQKNPDMVKKQRQRVRLYQNQFQSGRRQRVKEQTPPDINMQAIMEFYIKAEQLTKETGVTHEVDHIIPICKGGLHHQNNLQVITRTENRKKGGKIIS